jgi:hypothetical protein
MGWPRCTTIPPGAVSGSLPGDMAITSGNWQTEQV